MMSFSTLLDRLGRETWRNPLVFILVWVPALTLFILSFNPALTAELSLPARAAYWGLHVTLLLPLLMVLQEGFAIWLSRFNIGPLVLVVITALSASVIFLPIAMVLDLLFSPIPDQEPDSALSVLFVDEMAALAPPVLCVWILVNGTRLALLSRPVLKDTEMDAEADAAAASDPSDSLSDDERAFWSKVPRALGHDLVSLSAEQHYLRVHTTRGKSLILFPISRAVDAVARLDGMRIHRSHWVALRHVAGLRRDGATLVCDLSDGRSLPVSRNNQKIVQARLAERQVDDAARALVNAG